MISLIYSYNYFDRTKCCMLGHAVRPRKGRHGTSHHAKSNIRKYIEDEKSFTTNVTEGWIDKVTEI